MTARPSLASLALLSALAAPLALSAAPQAVAPVSASPSERARTERAAFLEMFARAYFPGRSGQVMVVGREGEILTRRGAEVAFMHGSPWAYDAQIPLIFWGAPFVRAGRYTEAATQEDVAPTLGRALDLSLTAVTGHVLTAALRPGAPAPKAVVLLVLDAFRADYLERYASLLPNLTRLRREGASFDRMRVSHLPTITSVGHATVATGTEPRFHGIVANTVFNRVTGKVDEAFPNLSPANLFAPTLSDRLNLETDGRAVILAQTSTGGATGIAGHGACLLNGRPSVYASYSYKTGHWETDATCFRLPDYLKDRDAKTMWQGTDGKWMGHPIADPDNVRRSPLLARFEGDALVSMIEKEPLGADDVPDMVSANLKLADYVGHAYGPDSEEMRAALPELDREIARILEALDQKLGRDTYLLAITADHGMPPEPVEPHGRRYNEDIVKLIHDRFDPENKLVTHYGAENAQIDIDLVRARELHVTMEQVRDLLQAQPYVLYAFTEDEVRRARVP